MPKILADVRARALAETRQVLEQQGYGALAMRDIAKKCQVAVGTLYNYFPSKEYLTGSVVLEDWTQCYDRMTSAAAAAVGFGQGLREIYELMLLFVREHRYLNAFEIHDSTGTIDVNQRHLQLRGQIEELLRMLEKRLGHPVEPDVLIFLAECILSFSVKGYTYEQIAPAILKLIQ